MLSFFKISFYFAYFFLAGSTVLTAFEVLNYFPVKYEALKYILTLETTVNIIASIAYNKLITLIDQPNYDNITIFRYLDWFATTPLLLISLIIYLSYVKNKNENNKTIEKKDDTYNIILKDNNILIIILLNLLMLTFGYIGEAKVMNYIVANILGYIPFILMLYMIWKNYCDQSNMYIFIIFSVVWSMYGVVYYFDNNRKNISYNILDIIAKVGVGILIWYQVVQYKLENIDNLKNNIGNDNNIVKKL